MEAVVSAPRLLTGALPFQRFTKSPSSFLSLRTSLRSSISDGSVSRPSFRTAAISSMQEIPMGYHQDVRDRRTISSRPQPPDLASYLYSNRIVYLATPIVPPVMELIVAQLLYLQAEDAEKPISLYINSTGTLKDGQKLGNELEALGVYDVMRYIEAPISTLCIGKAWGEAAILLAAGDRGSRYALPSSSIMIREPVANFDGQVSDVVLAREDFGSIKAQMVNILSEHTGKPPEQIEQDIKRPKYFSPSAAVEYGIIDQVFNTDRDEGDQSMILNVKQAKLLKGGACGYGDFGRDINGGDVGAVSRLYRNGSGCGACYQPWPWKLAHPNMAAHLIAYGTIDVEYRRISCQYPGNNLIFKVTENSRYPDYLALVILYQAGQRDIMAVELWQEDCKEWRGMRRAYGAVWDSVNPPNGPMNMRLQVSGDDGAQNWVQLTAVVPNDWKAGVSYDSAVQLT
ncbi:hypothetical protein J5N97_001119 [Dioscorea zingiberensis]|uniref:ATP-dependent Clp protease proteolytic subunit n=1 Tax=Dioscorea zingiberensis TaxID=325984 RepID=A0A9D5H386_9LILI|nr:hypothetical protein J5N97_001119 [Dioscorea zingiberensis]